MRALSILFRYSAAFLALLFLWQIGAWALGPYLLPAPLDVLDASAGDFTEGEVHGAHCVLMRSAVLQEKAVARMKEDETFFVDDPDGLIAAEKAKN